ncbi:MAG TPA: ATP-dependent sacrificial sulfur transferase LarE [Kiritimatiellae bacterium]|nr:ATP-dependent sacrificial sulfur transferase LarE [Kiritimatiellia bacterium]
MRRLGASLNRMGSVAVGFSGGADSAFLLAVAAAELPGRVLAVTAGSPTLPRADAHNAADFAARLGVEHVWIQTREMESEEFTSNPPQRCYYCKRELFSSIRRAAAQRGIRHVLEAGNVDDLADYRPGRRALAELGIISPLVEAGFTKQDIREASRLLGLETAGRPASACLASRIPYGRRITVRDLRMVDRAEGFLRELGFTQVRVRHHGDLARIEVEEREIPRLAVPDIRRRVAAALRACGFRYVTVDLMGYRTGSLNEGLPAGSG